MLHDGNHEDIPQAAHPGFEPRSPASEAVALPLRQWAKERTVCARRTVQSFRGRESNPVVPRREMPRVRTVQTVDGYLYFIV